MAKTKPRKPRKPTADKAETTLLNQVIDRIMNHAEELTPLEMARLYRLLADARASAKPKKRRRAATTKADDEILRSAVREIYGVELSVEAEATNAKADPTSTETQTLSGGNQS